LSFNFLEYIPEEGGFMSKEGREIHNFQHDKVKQVSFRKLVWASIYGASVAAQVRDFLRSDAESDEGLTKGAMLCFMRGARAIADLNYEVYMEMSDEELEEFYED
jgi:hypothetical protein